MNAVGGPRRLCAAFAMQQHLPASLFDAESLGRLCAALDIDLAVVIDDFGAADKRLLSRLDVLITGWGSPVIDDQALAAMPRLQAVFHAAGTVKHHVSSAVWERGITVTTAAAANSLPVAEYSVAMILLAGKSVLPIMRAYRDEPDVDVATRFPDTGNYRRTLGVIGASTVGRLVIAMLAPTDVEVLLYDPLIADGDPLLSSVTRVSLDELFRRSTVVSVHAPLLEETRGMVGAAELALLRAGSTVINTARAPIVDQDALQAEVTAGRLFAVLDVTTPERLPARHPLLGLAGALLTPHIAGALGNEILRLGESAVREVERFVSGRKPAYPVLIDDLKAMA